MAAAGKLHAVCIPYPHQSHIKATLNLAKLLYHKGFHITFVNTEFNHKRILKSRGSSFLDCLPDFHFESIPDGLPPSDLDASQDARALSESISHSFLDPFRCLLRKLNQTASSDNPPVTCIVADGVMPFTFTAAEEIGIPVAVFFPFAACGVLGFYKFKYLVDNGLAPLEDISYLTNGYLDKSIEWTPTKQIHLKDLPSYLRTTDPKDIMFNFLIESAQQASRASVVAIHTFDALEQEVLEYLSSKYALVYAIGPLGLLLNQIPRESPLNTIECNMWKEEPECLQWLNNQRENSVLYVNFGSVIVLTPEQLEEFCWGIANSKHPFLWIVRPDIIHGKSSVLPHEFVEETKDRCYISSWCPQEEVLKHPSVGGFLTHCGWNSIIESLSSGIPMLCWPVKGDQQPNSKYACSAWEVGLEMEAEVKRNDIENLVRELIVGGQGERMRNKAREWKKKAEAATSQYGSSSLNLDKLVELLNRWWAGRKNEK